MRALFQLLFIVVVGTSTSCVKIPKDATTLVDAVQNEGKRMHDLNLALLNQLFERKRAEIDLFIKNEYTPIFISNFKKLLPDTLDFETHLPDMLESISKEVNGKRDIMQSTLETQRIKLVSKLGQDFMVYNQSCEALHDLVSSASKVEEGRSQLTNKLGELSNGKIDFLKLEGAIDKFIKGAGYLGEESVEFEKQIDKLIK